MVNFPSVLVVTMPGLPLNCTFTCEAAFPPSLRTLPDICWAATEAGMREQDNKIKEAMILIYLFSR